MNPYRKPQLSPEEISSLQEIMDMFRYAPEERHVSNFDYMDDTSIESFQPQVYFYSFRRLA